MAQVLIRNLPEQAVEVHRRRARARGRSLEAELREVISERSRLNPEERVAFARAMQARSRAAMVPGVPQTPGSVLIREDRDADDR